MEIRGRVFTGMGKGAYYVGHPEYQKRFKDALGYNPYPGTLNLRVEEADSAAAAGKLSSYRGVKVEGFEIGGETFSAVRCYPGRLGESEVAVLAIDITYYNDKVVELISPVYLRGAMSIKDGDVVAAQVLTA